MDGERGCLPHLERSLSRKGYAVVVVAEGAGEDILGQSAEKDAGGNKKLPPIGAFMKKQVLNIRFFNGLFCTNMIHTDSGIF